MADTAILDAALGAETPTEPTTPAPSLTEASSSLKGKTSWEEVFTPAAADAAPETTTETPAEAPAAESADALSGFTLDAEGRLHRKDGTYASQAEVDQWNSSAEQAPPAAEQQPEQPKAEEPQPIVVAIRGRDGKDLEIEVTDEQTAEALRTNHREGMRAAEFNRRMAEVQAKEEEFRAFEMMIEQNPEGVILRHLPEEKQDALLVALLARRWDAIAPQLVKFDSDPTARAAEMINTQRRIEAQDGQFSSAKAKAEYGKQVYTETVKLIPEHVDEATQQRFLADAGRDIEAAIRQNAGNAVPLETIKTLLAPRIALYGFDRPQGATTPSASTPSTPKRPLARPVVSAPQSAAPVTVDPGAAIRRTVTAQRIAAATPPQGAGAAPVRQPLTPPNVSVTDASRALKRAKSWAEVGH